MLLSELTWPEVKTLIPDTPVLVPVAATEQHGPHMPIFTDSLLLGEIVRRAHEILTNRVLITPLMWLGNSDHHLDFAGTLSARPRVYLELLNGIIDDLLHHGFRRILIINGHGGNDVPGKQAIYEARQRYRNRSDLLLLFATYWALAEEPQRSHPDLHQTRMGHACEWETSMMLRLRPELVRNHLGTPAVPFGKPFEPASRGWIMTDRSSPGHVGDPTIATPEKGEALFASFTAGLVAMVERMIAWDGSSWDG
jgi:creatinine amidohydrolase